MPIGDRVTPEMSAKYKALGYWPTVSSMDLLDKLAEVHPDKVALVDRHHRITFAQWALFSKRLAIVFHERGLRKGEYVVCQIPNSCLFMVIQYAFRRVGVIAYYATMDQRQREIQHALRYTDSVAVILPSNNEHFDYVRFYRDDVLPGNPGVRLAFTTGRGRNPGMISLDDLLSDPIETRYPAEFLDHLKPDIDDPTHLTSTSGTTALPKFIVLKEHTAAGRNFVDRMRLTADDGALVLAPLRGGASNAYKYTVTLTGMKGVFQPRFDAEEALRLVEQERTTMLCAVPAQYVKMLDCPNFDRYDLSSLRLAFYAGAYLPPEIADAIHDRMGAEIISDYGAMDAGIMCLSTLDDPHEVRCCTSGRPIPGVTARVVDSEEHELPVGEIGELWFHGPCVGRTGGYLKDPEMTARNWTPDDWYKTGDMGIINQDGTVAVVGRKKDMIIRGGQNISPKEVEDLVLLHPHVHDVAVVSVLDRVMGEKACAFVIPKSGHTITLEELVGFLRQQGIAAYKLPEHLELVDRLPMSADGQKVQKHLLREILTRKSKEGVNR